MTRMKRKSHRTAIIRALARQHRTKPALIRYLGAQDAHDAVDYDLQKLRREGLVRYVRQHDKGGSEVWQLTKAGLLVFCGKA